jgi:hypothetical protein
MFEMGSHDPFGHLKHKLWPKEGSGVELAIELLTIKSQELSRFPCVQVVCHILLESSQWVLQLWFRPHLNWRSAEKVMGPKVVGVLTLGISGLPLRSLETKCHLDVGLMERHIIYYKGEGGGFSQVRAMVSVVSLNSPVVRFSTKSAQTMH